VQALAGPKLGSSEDERPGDFLPYAEVMTDTVPLGSEPRCRDPHDQQFLDLAIAAGADALVTGDKDLLSLAERCPVAVLTVAELRNALASR
jgi:predicted nucleic acid-binding protein